jgi:hypothetical protein
VPLVQLDGVLCEGSTEGSGSIAVHAVAFGHLRLVVLAIWLDKTLDVTQRRVETVFDFLKHGKVVSGRYGRERCELLRKSDVFGSEEVSLQEHIISNL